MGRIDLKFVIAILGMALLGCPSPIDPGRNAKAITAFSFASPAATGTINETAHTIAVSVPYGTAVTALSPTITHTGASISPASGSSQNFSNPVTYTVTAADGTTQSYVVTVTAALSSAKAITAFSFASPAATGTINETAHTIAVSVPYGTAVTALSPTITHTGASISPASGSSQNFSNPVTYTVTAADGTTQSYVVTVTAALSSAKAITAFSFASPAATGTINETAHTIAVSVPYGTAVTALSPTITHTGASISPASGSSQNFSNPVTYTVTAADGTTQSYVVTVTAALSSAKAITAFSFASPAATGTINETAHTIAVSVPYGTAVTALSPTITHTGASISPASGSSQNFSNPVTYTVTAADGTTQSYVVTVTAAAPSTNADLGALTVSSGTLTPAFTAATTSYTVSVLNSVSTITVTGTKADVNASVAINPAQPSALSVGANVITVTVTAQSGAMKVYTVTVTRALSANADLSALTVSSGTLTPVFSAATTRYAVSVLNSAITITVTGTKADANASVGINPAQPSALGEGANTITITVTAQNGATKTYSIDVYRASLSPNIGNLMFVPAGTFQRDETPTNTSAVSVFRMSEKEITVDQFTAVTGLANPSTSFTAVVNGPVQEINWYHTMIFCNKLSMLEGKTPVYTINGSTDPAVWGALPNVDTYAIWDAVSANWSANGYRLPTEMEWMWAAMGATSGSGYISGTYTVGYQKEFAGDPNPITTGDIVDDYAWYAINSAGTTHTVGTKLASELGLYDMSGNVSEWCWDWNAMYPTGALTDYRGAASSGYRVIRGSYWDDSAYDSKVSIRAQIWPNWSNTSVGFRVIRH